MLNWQRHRRDHTPTTLRPNISYEQAAVHVERGAGPKCAPVRRAKTGMLYNNGEAQAILQDQSMGLWTMLDEMRYNTAFTAQYCTGPKGPGIPDRHTVTHHCPLSKPPWLTCNLPRHMQPPSTLGARAQGKRNRCRSYLRSQPCSIRAAHQRHTTLCLSCPTSVEAPLPLHAIHRHTPGH